MTFVRPLRLLVVGLLCAASFGLAGPASADALQDCIDQGNAQGMDAPSCTENPDGTMTPFDGGDGFGGDDGFGIPAGFIVLMVLALLLGIAITVWKVKTARKLASDSGMDPDIATGMTLLDDNGLAATYLASSLRGPKAAEPAVTPATSVPASAADRLGELKRLLDGGLITQTEYDDRRKAVVDSL